MALPTTTKIDVWRGFRGQWHHIFDAVPALWPLAAGLAILALVSYGLRRFFER